MSNVAWSPASTPGGITDIPAHALGLLERIPVAVPELLFRLGMGLVFWRSGQSKLASWDTTLLLFREEYRLPVIDPTLAAYLAAAAEHIFPILLVIGLATRFSALALLIMTLVIQIFVYPDAWPTHGTWAAIFLMLMAQGPGKISLDALIARSRQ